MRAIPDRFLIGMLAAATLVLPHAPAMSGPALVLDQSSGQVLYAEDADHSWYPASLTKMMTAYVTFEALKSGQIALDTKVPLSETARGQPATRIGLRAGIELTVDQAVRGMILRSANDFSMALAELIGESEEGFAVRMNAAAKRLGMTRSHFKNPHGLPDPEQMTTARDMAVLARALQRDFPDRADVFSTLTVGIHRGTFHNQNDLLRTLTGADGMKTGFTCGAGYNIVASATRDGRRIIAVVLGEVTRINRSERAAALLEHGFQSADWKQLFKAPVLERMALEPPAADAVHDMSRMTLASQCGNRVRRPRLITAGGVRRAVTGTTAPKAVESTKLEPAAAQGK